RSRGAVAAARAELDAARAEEAKAERNLRLDLTQAYLGAKEAHERMEVTRKSLESAREALRITREQYEQGAADVALLLQAQVGVTAMRTRAVAAEYDTSPRGRTSTGRWGSWWGGISMDQRRTEHEQARFAD
ncbi:MAG TPA: TolC family protein, partial [Kiritimatiellia bacterium]|nr:TolC family protein [Kiritimatiellia bacterium]